MLTVASPLRLRVTGQAGAISLDTLQTERVPAGELWEIHNHCWRDITTTYTDARVYVAGHGYKHYRSYQTGPAANIPRFDPERFLLGEGEALAVDFVGAANNDLLELFVDGARLIEA